MSSIVVLNTICQCSTLGQEHVLLVVPLVLVYVCIALVGPRERGMWVYWCS